ncbi:hypothetical protein PFISCL1PPCAC_6175, partial [Pristionchus fissidentatus]
FAIHLSLLNDNTKDKEATPAHKRKLEEIVEKEIEGVHKRAWNGNTLWVRCGGYTEQQKAKNKIREMDKLDGFTLVYEGPKSTIAPSLVGLGQSAHLSPPPAPRLNLGSLSSILLFVSISARAPSTMRINWPSTRPTA